MDNNQSKSNRIGLATLLTLVFVVLKLTGLIGWSWWWVVSPSIVEVALFAAILTSIVVNHKDYFFKRPSKHSTTHTKKLSQV